MNGLPVFVLSQHIGPAVEVLDVFEAPDDAMAYVEFRLGYGLLDWKTHSILQITDAVGKHPVSGIPTRFEIASCAIRGRSGRSLRSRREAVEQIAAATKAAAFMVADLAEAQRNQVP